jgi:multiple sugar transport system permease protein
MAKAVNMPRMLGITLTMVIVTEVGVLLSSIVVAYGFARFPLPGGNALFYILIATILIPDKVTHIPTYFFNFVYLHWVGTLYPLIVPFLFGSAVYIFLLRQNFKGLPIDLEEAAMLDGAGPLRRLFSIILPQSWPVVVTVSLLHFFYIWNETRLASVYLGAHFELMPLSFAVQPNTSVPPVNALDATTLLVMALPILLLFLSQRLFLQGMIITGAEKKL